MRMVLRSVVPGWRDPMAQPLLNGESQGAPAKTAGGAGAANTTTRRWERQWASENERDGNEERRTFSSPFGTSRRGRCDRFGSPCSRRERFETPGACPYRAMRVDSGKSLHEPFTLGFSRI